MVVDTASGVAVGAVTGAIAGPAGMAAGAVLGGAIGAIAAAALELDREDASSKDAQLDLAIGVTGGNIGEASPDQPPSRGAFSAAAMGISSSGGSPSEGPIQDLEEG
jgi:hypothetical protein